MGDGGGVEAEAVEQPDRVVRDWCRGVPASQAAADQDAGGNADDERQQQRHRRQHERRFSACQDHTRHRLIETDALAQIALQHPADPAEILLVDRLIQPKLMLPLSLSYDHRVINGAAAARFTKRLSELLADIRTMLL